MGCVWCTLCKHCERSKQAQYESIKKEYSWDKRTVNNFEKLIIKNKGFGTYGRLPGEINGLEFIVQNCKDAFIYLFDHINAITIDSCQNCTIVIGPVKTSLFILNSNKCKLVVSCQQFRVRNCVSIISFVACVSQPIIESSTNMEFAPYQLYYPQLKEHFKCTKMSVFNFNWSSIHDFSPNSDGILNYSFQTQNDIISHIIQLPQDLHSIACIPMCDKSSDEMDTILKRLIDVKASTDKTLSIVPMTLNLRDSWPRADNTAFAIVVLFYQSQAEDNAMELIRIITASDQIYLFQSRSSTYSSNDFERIFKGAADASLVKLGAVITLQFHGPVKELGPLCESSALELIRARNIQPPSSIHVTVDPLQAEQQAQRLDNFNSM